MGQCKSTLHQLLNGMKTVKGDLLHLARQGHFDVIVHGCNCFRRMGSGIARQVALEYPEAQKEDDLTPYGDVQKLGGISHCLTKDGFRIVNAYTQFEYGYNDKRVYVDYEALRLCFKTVAMSWYHKRIGYPMIGSGLAKGDWMVISGIIEDELDGIDHTLVIYEPNKIL